MQLSSSSPRNHTRVILLIFIILHLSLPISYLTGCAKKEKILESKSTQTEAKGEVKFRSATLKKEITVKAQDKVGKPLPDMDVQYLVTKEYVVIMVRDPHGKYLPDIFVGRPGDFKEKQASMRLVKNAYASPAVITTTTALAVTVVFTMTAVAAIKITAGYLAPIVTPAVVGGLEAISYAISSVMQPTSIQFKGPPQGIANQLQSKNLKSGSFKVDLPGMVETIWLKFAIPQFSDVVKQEFTKELLEEIAEKGVSLYTGQEYEIEVQVVPVFNIPIILKCEATGEPSAVVALPSPGLSLTLQIEMTAAVKEYVTEVAKDFRKNLLENSVQYTALRVGEKNSIHISLKNEADRKTVERIVKESYSDFRVCDLSNAKGQEDCKLVLLGEAINRIEKRTFTQTLEKIRNRITEFGAHLSSLKQLNKNTVLVYLREIEDTHTAAIVTDLVTKSGLFELKLFEQYDREKLKKRSAVLSSELLDDVIVEAHDRGKLILLLFNPEGKKILEQITSENIGKRMAILIDDQQYGLPVISGKVTSGKLGLYPLRSTNTARGVAVRLKTGRLPAPVTLLERRYFDLSKVAQITDEELQSLMEKFGLDESRRDEYRRAFDRMITEIKKESGYQKYEIRKVFEQPPEITNSPVGNITAHIYSWHRSSRGNKLVFKWYLQYDDNKGGLFKLHTTAPKGTY